MTIAECFQIESTLRRFIENEKYEKKYLANLVRDESNLPSSTSDLQLMETEMEDEGIQLAYEKRAKNKSKSQESS